MGGDRVLEHTFYTSTVRQVLHLEGPAILFHGLKLVHSRTLTLAMRVSMTADGCRCKFDPDLVDKLKMLEAILDESDQLVQMSYLDDMTMVYTNAAADKFRGGAEKHRGRQCFEYMMGLEEQCPFCPLLKRGESRNASTEIDNGHQVFSVKTLLTEWKGRPAFVEYAADITANRRAQQGFEAQVQTLLDSIPEAQGVMHFDLTENRCITVNGAATNNLKSVEVDVEVDTTLGQVFSFIPDVDERKTANEVFNRNALIKAYQEGRVEISREVESYFEDGSVRWARVSARIILNPANDHLECIFYGMDISDEVERRRGYEERAHRQEALFNALSRDYLNVFLVHPEKDEASILKLDGFVTTGLKKGETQPYPYKQICERYIAERVYEDDRAAMRLALSAQTVMRKLEDGPEYIGTYRVLDNGSISYYQFKYLMAENDEGIIAGFQNVDATIAEELERQKVLKEALDAAEEASRAKSIFLSNMSHDIRTPLNAIIGFNDLAKEHLNDPEVIRRYLDKVSVAGKHLLGLVNDVLDMSHIESGMVGLDETAINLPAMFEDLHTVIDGNAQHAGVELIVDVAGVKHPDVVGDEVKLKKVLVNILGNAVKFTPAGGKVWFTVEERSLPSSDYAHFVFRVRDNGVGISKEFQPHVFEAFAREEQPAGVSIGGTGLGLSIVKNLVNIMDGTIHVESEKGKGTEFVVSLHLKVDNEKRNELPSPVDDGDELDVAGKSVLLVEDNELNREIAFEILTGAGFVVDTACDGEQAVEKVRDAEPGTYDIVLMDIQMPRMNGYEAARAIRELSDPQRAGIPIVALTANAFSSDRDEALAAGMDGHISKPIDVNLLINTMRDLLK